MPVVLVVPDRLGGQAVPARQVHRPELHHRFEGFVPMALPISRKSLHRGFNDTVEGMDIKDTARPLDGAAVSAFLRSLPGPAPAARPGRAHPRRGRLLELRNELFRQLVEQEGYRTIAIESDCLHGPGRGRLRHDGHGHARRRHGARLQPRLRRVRGQPRARALDARVQRRPARVRAGSASPASTARWRSPAPRAPARPSPHSTLPRGPVDAHLLPCTAETLDRAARRRRPVDRTRPR